MRYAIAALLFLGCGFNPSTADTPLITAARSGDVARVRQLLAQGADPNQRSGVNHWPALLHAVHTNQLGTAAALIDCGAEVNRGYPYNYTPLMMAAGYGHPAMVRLLLARGADTRVVNMDGDTALDRAYIGDFGIDGFTFFTCQGETKRLLHAADSSLQPSQFARRWARVKGCGA